MQNTSPNGLQARTRGRKEKDTESRKRLKQKNICKTENKMEEGREEHSMVSAETKHYTLKPQ